MSEDNEVVKQPEAEADGASTESKEVSSESKASNGEVKTADKVEEKAAEPTSATSDAKPAATATVAAETSPAKPSTASAETPAALTAETPPVKAEETPVAKPAETPAAKPVETPAAKPAETPETKAPVVSVTVTPAATPAAASAAATPASAPAVASAPAASPAPASTKVPATTPAAPLAAPPTLPTPQVPQQGGITQRRSRWYTSTAALRYISSLSRDQEVKVRDSDRATSIFLLIAAIATVLSLILSPLAHLRLQLVMVCDALVGAMLLFYVVNRFGIINTLTPRQAILAWQLMVGSAFMGVFLTINFAVIVALIMAQTSVEIPR